MKQKNNIEVLIGGNKYTLSGYESADYLQKVTNYINAKIEEITFGEGKLMNQVSRNAFIQLSIADELFKQKQAYEELLKEKEDTDKMLFDLKHEVISTKDKLDRQIERNKQLVSKLEAAGIKEK